MIEFARGFSEDLTELYQQKLKKEVTDFSAANHFNIDFVGESLNTILVGEMHRMYDGELISLIRSINPGLIVHEALAAYRFDPKQNQLFIQEGRMVVEEEHRDWGELLRGKRSDTIGRMPFLRTSVELGVPIIGADFSFYEERDYLERAYPASVLHGLEVALNTDEEKYVQMLDALTRDARDSLMSRIVRDNLGSKSSPTIAILGFMHAYDISVRGGLNNYALIEAIPSDISASARARYFMRRSMA